ncbi:MAG: hypothetical protein KF731_10860, partial [Thauera sp.]|nr:hypothetical protein [Thauera sp.]
MSQPPQLPAATGGGAILFPSARSQAGLFSRTSGTASAIRNLRIAVGNCLFATTYALTATAMAMTRYCRASEAS